VTNVRLHWEKLNVTVGTKWFHLIGSETKLFLTLSSKHEFFPKIYFEVRFHI